MRIRLDGYKLRIQEESNNNFYTVERRKTRPVKVGDIVIGGNNPVVVQSMTNTSTLDTEGSAAQAKAIADAGGQLVRLTTQGSREAANLRNIREAMKAVGCEVPISADVHFNPKAAFEAATTADKVRINPGNFVKVDENEDPLEVIRTSFVPFLELCRENGTAVRLGVNHGSLSERIMNKYGDTPLGMVASVMEYLQIAREVDFHDIIISIKASNTVVMVETVRLLAATMDKEGMNYPMHLGVTEAGDAEDGRIKSAVGIGALLLEGLGDTIRVSLSEPPENEIPVARLLVSHAEQRLKDGKIEKIAASLQKEKENKSQTPVTITIDYDCTDLDELRVRAGADFGALLLSGFGDEIKIINPNFDADTLTKLEADIMQAARRRFYKTEYISCPSCGRTLFDLQSTLKQVKEAVNNLGIQGLKIGVMGCIVNGPGEMADADYGYVGAGPGRVSIYKGKELVIKNVSAEEALEKLLELIRKDYC